MISTPPSLKSPAEPISKGLLRDLLLIAAPNWHFGPRPALTEMRFGRHWRTIGTLSRRAVRTHNPLVVCSNHTGPSCFC